MIDIVAPRGNEEKLAEMAERLGFGSICFLYDRVDEKKIEKAMKIKEVNVFIGGKNKDISFSDVSKGDIRNIIEGRNVDVVYGFEGLKLRDSLKQRSSGLDPVMCKIAFQRKKIYCVDFGRILGVSRNLRGKVLGRLKQNLMLCKKYRIPVAIASFADSPLKMRNPLDLAGLLAVLGFDNGKKPLEVLQERIIFNRKKKSGEIIREGIERV